jgi:hypothetical protein
MQTLEIPDEQETIEVTALPEIPVVKPPELKKFPWMKSTMGILCAVLVLFAWYSLSAVPEREPRVMKGITFLDNAYGLEWPHKINWEELDIHNTEKCILGQLEGRYDMALQKFNTPEGFGDDHGFMPSVWESGKKLTAVWREFGKYRLGAAEMF